MDKINVIYDMLEGQRLYRKSFVDDLITEEKKYKILIILMKRANIDSIGTYNIEKEVIRLQKIREMSQTLELKDPDISEQFRDIWENSLRMLLDHDKGAIDVKQSVDFYLQKYRGMIHIGNIADINLDKLELDKLKIKYMTKNRR